MLGWTTWSTDRSAPAGLTDEPTRSSDHDAMFPAVPRVSADEGAAAYHAWERGTTAVVSDHELFNLVIKRSVSDLRLLVNEGPGEDQRYISAGVPWFATLFGRDSRDLGPEPSRSGPRSPLRSSRSSPRTRRPR